LATDEDRLVELEGTVQPFFGKRDSLNEQADRLRGERDRLNESVRGLRAKAIEEKNARDDINKEVAERKEQVNLLRARLEEKRQRLVVEEDGADGHRRHLPPRFKLQKELQDIEWELATTPTLEMKEREAELIEKTGELRNALKEYERIDAEEDRRLISLADSKAVEMEIRGHRDEMDRLSDESEGHHERMLLAYRSADEEKKRADEVHARFIEVVNQIREVNSKIDGVMAELKGVWERLNIRDRASSGERARSVKVMRESLLEEARRKLKAGEKLTLEEMKLVYGEG